MNPFVRRSKRAARLLMRTAYYLMPPAFYQPWKYCLPRVFQRDVRSKFRQAVLIRLGWSAPDDRSADIKKLWRQLQSAYWLPETTSAESKTKAGRYRKALAAAINRGHISQAIARLERFQGRDLTAAVYALRAMRLNGGDRFGDLGWVQAALVEHGYRHEAEAVDAMYGNRPDRDRRCRELIDQSVERCRTAPPSCDFVHFDDCRGSVQPRVSVIVSLYNAASKIRVFMEAMRHQTLVRAGQLELLLVDSASPMDERRAVGEALADSGIPYLFVRTPQRESIQTAWNRGIALARAPYLSFLGVDETVLPEAFEKLAQQLDADPELDWIMADSLMRSVDARGNPSEDVMVYDRRGYTPDLVRLETCYLSWVGGLYRKSIHDRFGLYDGSFRAAGDTEFKGRVLPSIKTKHLPGILGIFLNYPEERTTASPRAELEDYRAWYLHRTAAGVRYVFDGRPTGDLEAMLATALSYRKSYCKHRSSDVEYAGVIARVLRERSPDSPFLALAPGIERLLEAYRSLDFLTATTARSAAGKLAKCRAVASSVQKEHRATGLVSEADYQVFNDNRYEQHTHPW